MKVRYYITADGKTPFTKWLDRLRDKQAHGGILARIARLQLGLVGDTRSLGDGVYELKVNVGPGYRVYYALSGNDIVLLLCGGDKSTQKTDIETAKGYWKLYKEGAR